VSKVVNNDACPRPTTQEFSQTVIGKHPDFHVVGVLHSSPRCLIEEVATGPTLAKLLSLAEQAPVEVAAAEVEEVRPPPSRGLPGEGSQSAAFGNADVSRRKVELARRAKPLVLEALTEFHRTVIRAKFWANFLGL
jgi:hypothetical protein